MFKRFKDLTEISAGDWCVKLYDDALELQLKTLFL